MITQEITDFITPIILYLQEFAAEQILLDLLHRLTYDISDALQCLRYAPEHLQALTSDPTAMIIPDTKETNVIFRKILPIISFKTDLSKRPLDNIMQLFL